MFGPALQGASSQGLNNYENLYKFSEAMKAMKQQQLARQALGNYMQQTLVPPSQTPSPGQSSAPMTQPGATKTPSPAQAGTLSNPSQGMSLDGLMGYLKDRGITGEDALATAEQFNPWLAAEDKQKLGQMKFQLDMEKLLIANGFDQQKAKNEAARIAAYRERTKAMLGKGGQRDQLKALTATVQQLTVGRQKLDQQRSDIVNAARNAGRMLTAKEQATINAINQKIQVVDNGMAAARQQQALLSGGLNYGNQPDEMGQPDASTDSAAGVDTGDGGGQ